MASFWELVKLSNVDRQRRLKFLRLHTLCRIKVILFYAMKKHKYISFVQMEVSIKVSATSRKFYSNKRRESEKLQYEFRCKEAVILLNVTNILNDNWTIVHVVFLNVFTQFVYLRCVKRESGKHSIADSRKDLL